MKHCLQEHFGLRGEGQLGGPSGMIYEHLRPLLDNSRDMQRLHQLGERFARAEVSQQIVDAVRMGRITALRKSDGCVRGIIAGDLFRRLVSRTIAKQLAKEVEAATAPFQHAFSTCAGCECVAHVIQGLCEMIAVCEAVLWHSIFLLVGRRLRNRSPCPSR